MSSFLFVISFDYSLIYKSCSCIFCRWVRTLCSWFFKVIYNCSIFELNFEMIFEISFLRSSLSSSNNFFSSMIFLSSSSLFYNYELNWSFSAIVFLFYEMTMFFSYSTNNSCYLIYSTSLSLWDKCLLTWRDCLCNSSFSYCV